jgi:hypothetical protein
MEMNIIAAEGRNNIYLLNFLALCLKNFTSGPTALLAASIFIKSTPDAAKSFAAAAAF